MIYLASPYSHPDPAVMQYLASAYSHPDPAVRQYRYTAACKAAARLLQQGINVFSPMAHSLPIAQIGGLPETTWAFWEPFDREYIALSEKVVVLTLDGWDQSVGVQAEIKIARELGKPVTYLAPEPEEQS